MLTLQTRANINSYLNDHIKSIVIREREGTSSSSVAQSESNVDIETIGNGFSDAIPIKFEGCENITININYRK